MSLCTISVERQRIEIKRYLEGIKRGILLYLWIQTACRLCNWLVGQYCCFFFFLLLFLLFLNLELFFTLSSILLDLLFYFYLFSFLFFYFLFILTSSFFTKIFFFYTSSCFILSCFYFLFFLLLFYSYCKRGNIRGTLIFADFAQNSASANSKTSENICDILYAHLGHIGVVYWSCVLMQMGNILENVWCLLCFYAAQLLVNVSWYSYDVNFLQYKNDKWVSVKHKFNNPRICFCAAKREILIPGKLTAFTVLFFLFT